MLLDLLIMNFRARSLLYVALIFIEIKIRTDGHKVLQNVSYTEYMKIIDRTYHVRYMFKLRN